MMDPAASRSGSSGGSAGGISVAAATVFVSTTKTYVQQGRKTDAL